MFMTLIKPTTGMDPGSRRYFWNLIRKARKYGVTTILSSHSMEECEALCSELVIMKNGALKCIGTSKYIKNKFGKGYTLMLKCRPQIEPTNEIFILEEFVLRNIPNSTIKGNHLINILVK
jgi:ABC-type multidrug transport system ATPase subunit